MKEKQIKMNLIVNSVTIVLLATILFICTAFAWYVTNKTVSANGIGGASAVGNLHVTNQNIYKGSLDDNGNLIPPDSIGSSGSDVKGILAGDVIYYGVTLQADNTSIKNLNIEIVGIDGGQWFTCPPEDLTTAEKDALIAASTNTNEKYIYSFLKASGSSEYESVTTDIYRDNNGIEFYISEIDGVLYRNDIYKDQNGKKYNMMDVYTIKLSAVYFIEQLVKIDSPSTIVYTTDDGYLSGYTLDDTTVTEDTDKNITVKKSKLSKLYDTNINEESDIIDGITVSNTDTSNLGSLERLELMKFTNWNPYPYTSEQVQEAYNEGNKYQNLISIIFQIEFTLPEMLTTAYSEGELSMNSLSRNNLSFDGMVIIGEDVTSNGGVSSWERRF